MSNSVNIIPSALDAAHLKEKAKSGDHKKVGQDQFLQLMITQLKNQDPSVHVAARRRYRGLNIRRLFGGEEQGRNFNPRAFYVTFKRARLPEKP